MQNYELMSIHRTRKGLPDKWAVPDLKHDYDAEMTGYDSSDGV